MAGGLTRRRFLAAAAIAPKQREFRADATIAPDPAKRLHAIGSLSLDHLEAHFAKETAATVDWWTRNGVDRVHGGFHAGPAGSKRLYYQGRALWLFSYLHGRFGEHLDAARQGHEKLIRHARLADGHWATQLSADWKVETGFFDIYADIYMILGLAEFGNSAKDSASLDLAALTVHVVMKTVLAPGYQGQGLGTWFEPGIRRLGTWLHLLSALTPLVRYRKDESIERIARFCVRKILEKHWQRSRGFAYEFLDHADRPFPRSHLSRYPLDSYYESLWMIDSFHSLQAAWLIMDEALRADSPAMFKDGMEMGFDTLAIHWENGANCGLGAIGDSEVGKPALGGRKITAILAEAYVFLLMAIEHTHSPLAVRWFERVFACAGLPHHRWDRAATLHEPRGILFSLAAIRRMRSREGRVSAFGARL